MLTRLVDLQRAALAPWLVFGRETCAELDPNGLGRAVLDHALANISAGELRPDDLMSRVADDLGAPLQADLIEDQPFYRLFALRRRGDRPAQRLLLVSPYSGYATRVLSPLVAALVPGNEVLLCDWRDARLVPAAAGPFDLEDQTLVVERLIRGAAQPLHVIGLSQSTLPVLAAVARIAAADATLEPRSMILLGGPIVPGPHGLGSVWFSAWHDLLDGQAFERVPPPAPGAGREVYPSLHQLMLIMLSHAEMYGRLQVQALIERMFGRAAGLARSLDDLQAVIDTPAELVRQTIHEVFLTGNLAGGRMRVAGEPVVPSAIRRSALMTVEAARDALIGRDDTHRAGALVSTLRHHRVTLPEASHPDLFTGPVAAFVVAPGIRSFVRACA